MAHGAITSSWRSPTSAWIPRGSSVPAASPENLVLARDEQLQVGYAMASRMEGDVGTHALESREHLFQRLAAEVEDAVAIAPQPLHLAREVGAALRIEHHVRVRMA